MEKKFNKKRKQYDKNEQRKWNRMNMMNVHSQIVYT